MLRRLLRLGLVVAATLVPHRIDDGDFDVLVSVVWLHRRACHSGQSGRGGLLSRVYHHRVALLMPRVLCSLRQLVDELVDHRWLQVNGGLALLLFVLVGQEFVQVQLARVLFHL